MGPVTADHDLSDIDEAVELANATRFGFQFGAFTSGLANAYYLGRKYQGRKHIHQ